MFACDRRQARQDGGAGSRLGCGDARRLTAGAIFLTVLFGSAPLWAEDSPARVSCTPDRALLRTQSGQVQFHVELADDPGERAQGLMGRESMARSAGMLFIYERPAEVAFWMKNTLIPLDMIFVDPRGEVVSVHANAQPHDLTAVPSGGVVQYVLEINGGLAERLGIVPGAVLSHPAIDPASAIVPCE